MQPFLVRPLNPVSPRQNHVAPWKPAFGVVLLGLLIAVPSVSAQVDFQGSSHLMPFDEDTIAYARTPDSGPVARLQKRIDSGAARLKPFSAFFLLVSSMSRRK